MHPELELSTAVYNSYGQTCGVMDAAGTGIACKSKNTETHELAFHAVPGDGTRELRFERLLAR
jgi:hypothetical protein